MNKIIKKIVLMCVSVSIMIFSSCEKEIIEIKSNDVNLTGKTHFVSINDVPFLFPSIEKFNADYNFLSNPSLKRRDGVQDLNLELSKIVEYAADNGCDSYSIPIKNELDINQDYYFENLNVTKLGDQFQPFITRFTASNQEKFSLTTFSGKIEILDLNKTLITTLPFENGQLKIPPVFVPRDFENDSSTGGGAGTGNGPGGFITWVLNQLGYSVLWSTMNNSWMIVSNGNSSSSGGINPNSNNNGSNLGNISLFPNGTQTWSTPNSSSPNTNGGNGGSFTIVPNPPTWIEDNTLADQINLIIQRLQPSANASRWLKNPLNSQFAQEIYDYMYQNPNINNSDTFVKQAIERMILNPNLRINLKQSVKSPAYIDTSSIDNSTPEGAKFTAVYNALMTSPKFKSLFIDLFGSPQSLYNVKFEIAEHVYDYDNPTEDINGDCSPLSTDNLIKIRINKQILTPSGDIWKNNLEVAKTILHECIHAYLFVKAKYPEMGMPIPNAQNMTFDQICNALYGPNVQHTFMYNNMIPTLQNILSQMLNILTTAIKRNEVEGLIVHPTITPYTSTPWSWNNYFYYLSFQGLDGTTSFQSDFQLNSTNLNLYVQYKELGHMYIDRIIP